MGVPFLLFVFLLDTVMLKTWVIKQRRTWIIMAHLLLLTAIFDQLLVKYIVEYTESNISGIRIGLAPLEDYMYTVAAVIGIGALLQYEKPKR